jgi:hypothetical protein
MDIRKIAFIRVNITLGGIVFARSQKVKQVCPNGLVARIGDKSSQSPFLIRLEFQVYKGFLRMIKERKTYDNNISRRHPTNLNSTSLDSLFHKLIEMLLKESLTPFRNSLSPFNWIQHTWINRCGVSTFLVCKNTRKQL